MNQKSDKLIWKYCKNKQNLSLTLAQMQNGHESIVSYGQGANLLEPEKRLYEIGSITKLFTSSLLAKLVLEGRVQLDQTIDAYLSLPSSLNYPTLLELATHSSGYSDPLLFDSIPQSLSWSFSSSRKGENPFIPFEEEWLLATAAALANKNKAKGKLKYSNFGYAVLGQVIGEVTGKGYYQSMIDFIVFDLGLSETTFGADENRSIHGFKKGIDFGNWLWPSSSVFASAGCLNASAQDLLRFASLNLSGSLSYLSFAHELQCSAGKKDGIGLGWMIDKKENLLWHNGGTGLFHAFLGISKEKNSAVVALSNEVAYLSFSEQALALELAKSF
ncbi:MAG: serine hydrolase domain-containing protein [Raoultibacter sp.]|jgi:CubicO group peptidase (beta-lactamase class C family)